MAVEQVVDPVAVEQVLPVAVVPIVMLMEIVSATNKEKWGIRIRWTGATGMDYWNGPLEWTTGPILRVTTTFAHAHSPLYLMPNSGLCSLCMLYMLFYQLNKISVIIGRNTVAQYEISHALKPMLLARCSA